jgi:hypothetical protein
MPDEGTNTDHDARYYTETEIGVFLALRVPYTGATTSVNLGANNITTTRTGTFGQLKVDTLDLNGNEITDSTGTVSFNDDDLYTVGNVLASTITGMYTGVFGNLTLEAGSITDSGGAISFGNENLSTTGTFRIDGGVGVGVAPTANAAYNSTLTAGASGTRYGEFNTITASGAEAYGYGAYNSITASGNISLGYGTCNVLTSSTNASQCLFGTVNTLNPHAASVTAYGEHILSGISVINNPTADQFGIIIDWGLKGTDTGNKRWAIYNNTPYSAVAGSEQYGGKVFLGTNNVKTYFGQGYAASICYNGTDLLINPKEAGTGIVNLSDANLTTTGLITTGNLDVDTLNLNANAITDSTGTISFDNENLTTTGTDTTGYLVVNQTADSQGIQINGYDDKSTDNFKLAINSAGTGLFEATSNMLFEGTSNYFRASASTYFQSSGDNTNYLKMSTTASYVILTSIGTLPLQILSASGNISFNDENLTTTGKMGLGTATPATSAILDLTSTTGALIVPRMTTVQRDALTAVNGMIIYNSTTTAFNFYENGAWVTK